MKAVMRFPKEPFMEDEDTRGFLVSLVKSAARQIAGGMTIEGFTSATLARVESSIESFAEIQDPAVNAAYLGFHKKILEKLTWYYREGFLDQDIDRQRIAISARDGG